MHYSSDIETLMNDGNCFNDCFSQEYVKYVNMWNFQVPWMKGGGGGGGEGEGGLSTSRYRAQRPLHFKSSVISATTPSFKFPRYRIKGHYSGQPIRTQQSYSYTL